jgi:hypothetical protein
MVPQHNSLQDHRLHPIQAPVWRRGNDTEEIKHQSLCTIRQAMAEDEEYSKKTIEGTRLEAVENITKYQQ